MLDPADRRIFENINRTLEDIGKLLRAMTRLHDIENTRQRLRAEAISDVEKKDILSMF